MIQNIKERSRVKVLAAADGTLEIPVSGDGVEKEGSNVECGKRKT